MSEPMNFSDEPLDTQQQFDDWTPPPEFAPPPSAGTFSAYVSEIRDEKEFDTQKGKRYQATVDFRIIGGDQDDRAITWQRLSNTTFERRSDGKTSSQMLDLIKSAGVSQAPRSNREFSSVLHGLYDRAKGASFKVQIEWEGFCMSCYEKELMQVTGKGTAAEAKSEATGEQKKSASKSAMKAKRYRDFPEMENGNGRKDTFICADCNAEVRARVKVVRFMPQA